MRRIERTTVFKRDFKRVMARHLVRNLEVLLVSTVTSLANDDVLPANMHDHSLVGVWKGHRECHLRPDLLLIYRKPKPDALQLVRLGTHSDLFK